MTGGPIGPIQVIPPGLTGLLQLKQTGRLPDSLSDGVAGVVELRDWYFTARRVDVFGLFANPPIQIAAASLVTGSVGFVSFKDSTTAIAKVPPGQIWFVEQATANLLTAVASDTFSFGIGIANPTTNQILSVGPIAVDTITARNRELTARVDRGFWAYPGDIFGLWIQDILSAAGVIATLSMRATPCPL